MSKDQSQEYRGNGEHEWEPVHYALGNGKTSRLRVPGGWLYRHTYGANDVIAFVPMPEVVKHKV